MNIYSSHFKFSLVVWIVFLISSPTGSAQTRWRLPPATGRVGIVVDERLSVLRATPDLSGKMVRRIGRGRAVRIKEMRRGRDGVAFYRVVVTRRTGGWLQRDALISPGLPGDDERLLRLIKGSEGFDLIARSRIFLDAFPRSPLRPTVLLLFGEELERAAIRLSREASRRLSAEKMQATSAPIFSYFQNYNGLDRYSRQGIRFNFDAVEKRFHYDGAAWREILRRYPESAGAREARERLAALSKAIAREK